MRDAQRTSATTRSEWERDQEAWNLPPQSSATVVAAQLKRVERIEDPDQDESTQDEPGGS